MLKPMALRSLIVVAAAFGVLMPGLARGEDAPDDALAVARQVRKLKGEGKHASAARLAAEGAAREDFASTDRVQLGGLARQNFDLSYEAGGSLADLCGLAAVMRLVAPLDTAEGRALKLAAAAEAEARIEGVAGAGWRSVCEPGEPRDGSADAQERRREGPPLRATDTRRDAQRPPEADVAPPASRRRVRTGVATLVPGLVLFAPMAALLAYREGGERELRELHADAAGRRLTGLESEQAGALNQRYRAATAGAAVLGAAGAALAVTGVVLLVTGGRPARVAVAPWGARGVGGLVLEAKF